MSGLKTARVAIPHPLKADVPTKPIPRVHNEKVVRELEHLALNYWLPQDSVVATA